MKICNFFSGGKYFGDIKRTGIFGVREEKLAITGSELETKEAVKKSQPFPFRSQKLINPCLFVVDLNIS